MAKLKENTCYRNSENHLQELCHCYLFTFSDHRGSTKIDLLTSSNPWTINTETKRMWLIVEPESYGVSGSFNRRDSSIEPRVFDMLVRLMQKFPPINQKDVRFFWNVVWRKHDWLHGISWNDTLCKSFLLSWNKLLKKISVPCFILCAIEG